MSSLLCPYSLLFFFFFNDTATTEIYTLSLHDALPICDVLLAVGTRQQDFTSGSHALYGHARVLGLNVQPLDAARKRGQPLVADARVGLAQLGAGLAGWRADPQSAEHTPALPSPSNHPRPPLP